MTYSSRLNTSALALRNLFRNKRRSLATLMAFCCGTMATLLFGGYAQSIRLGLETNIVRQGGHLQIQHPDYMLFGSGDPRNYAIENYESIIATLKSDAFLAPRIAVVSPVLSFSGVAGHYALGLSKTVLAIGTVAEDQAKLRGWNGYDLAIPIHVPKLFGTPPDSAVIGTGVARILQLCEPLRIPNCPKPTYPAASAADLGAATPSELTDLAANLGPSSTANGARLELLSVSTTGAPNVAELRVVHAERQGTRSFDDMFVGIHLSTAKRLIFGQRPPGVTSIVVQLLHSDDLESVKSSIEMMLSQRFPKWPLVVHDFRTLNPNFAQTIDLFDAIFGFIGVLIAVIVMFTVSNTMSMAVVERTVEIGTLRAMGLRPGGIQRLFMMEGALLGLAGACVGSILSLLVARTLDLLHLTWTPPGYVDPMPLIIHVWGEWKLIGGTAIALLVISTCSSWWAARRGAALEIVDALRHV